MGLFCAASSIAPFVKGVSAMFFFPVWFHVIHLPPSWCFDAQRQRPRNRRPLGGRTPDSSFRLFFPPPPCHFWFRLRLRPCLAFSGLHLPLVFFWVVPQAGSHLPPPPTGRAKFFVGPCLCIFFYPLPVIPSVTGCVRVSDSGCT